MQDMTVTVADMMAARDARAQMQRRLLARHEGACVVCLCMNIAGPVKSTPAIEKAFAWGANAVRAVLAPHALCFEGEIHEKTGPEAMFCVQADAMLLKHRLCALEDGEAIGRLLDIDVIASGGEKIARTALGLPARRCLLCGRDAPACARSRTHSADDLFKRAHEIIAAHMEADFVRRTAQAATRALLCEVAVTPKPGLVDRANAGAHEDMDMFTFIDSACALTPYFETCARAGLRFRGEPANECFDALRVPGLLAEADMRSATGGVNTHKGAIFSLGIACAALGMGHGDAPQRAENVLLRCGEMTKEQMAREFARMNGGAPRTFGERAFVEQGVGGVRAEAAAGFPSVRDISLPRLRACLHAGMSLNDAGLCALAALMAATQDTNALRRGGEEGARAMRQEAQAIHALITAALESGTAAEQAPSLHKTLHAFDARLCDAHISPGGCADLLALTFLMRFALNE